MSDDTGELEPAGDGTGHPGSRRRSRQLTPLQRAVGLLTRREHSRKELARKLVAKGVPGEEVEALVAKLAGAGWQDDARFAAGLVRWRAGGGYGPAHIRAELAAHGLDREAIVAALDTFEGEWAGQARDMVRRRYGEAVADDLKLRCKAADFLMRRGFDAATIRFATRFDPDD